MPQPWIEIAGGGQDEGCAVAILDVGWVNDRRDRQAVGVGEQVTFASLDLLAVIIAGQTAGLGSLDRLTVDDPGAGARLAHPQHQRMIDRLPQPLVPPAIEEPL